MSRKLLRLKNIGSTVGGGPMVGGGIAETFTSVIATATGKVGEYSKKLIGEKTNAEIDPKANLIFEVTRKAIHVPQHQFYSATYHKDSKI